MAETAIDAAMRRRVVWSSSIGNALEWFDFIVFGLFASTIGKLFFPKTDPNAGLLAAYGLFAAAYFARPIGGLFFGTWADRVGRKRALVSIVLAMALGTGLIGVMPTYQMIGVAAPFALLVARLIQGFSAGGEFGTSTAMLVEFAPPDRRGFYASFQFVAQAVSFVVGASFAFLLNANLSPETMESWGWRIPFLAGIVIAPIGLYLRSAVEETPEFQAFLAKRADLPNTPLRDVIARHPRALISLLLLMAGLTANTYLANIFLPNFAANDLRLRIADAQLGLIIVSLIVAAALPFAALLSDRFGRRVVMASAIGVYVMVNLALAAHVVSEPSKLALWALQGSGLLTVFISGPFAALALEAFPVNVRSTGASITYNFGVVIFGGLSPLITDWLVKTTHDKLAPFYYLAVCLLLSLTGLAILPKRDPATAR